MIKHRLNTVNMKVSVIRLEGAKEVAYFLLWGEEGLRIA